MKLDRDQLLECLPIERWADALAGRDFDSAQSLAQAGKDAATPLSETEVDQALSADPRIGLSLDEVDSEQSEDADADEQIDQMIRQGVETYEAQFGRAFVIRAKGRDRRSIADELDRRLMNDPGVETEEVAEQLRQIAIARLERLWGSA